MKKLKILLPVLLLAVWGCSGKQECKMLRTPAFNDVYQAKADSLDCGPLFIPVHFKITGEKMILFDNNRPEGVFTVAGYPDLSFKCRAVRKGRAGDEFISTNWADVLQGDQVALYDIPRAVLVNFRVKGDTLEIHKKYDLKDRIKGTDLIKPYVSIIQLNDSVFCMRSSDRSRDELVLKNLETGQTLNTVPDLLKRDPQKDQYLDYNYYIAANEDHLIKFYETEGRLELYTIDKQYRTVPRFVMTGTLYSQVLCADDVFYALAGDFMHVFDYEGTPVRKILLNRPVDYIVPDSAYKKMAGFNSNSESEIFYLYDISGN